MARFQEVETASVRLSFMENEPLANRLAETRQVASKVIANLYIELEFEKFPGAKVRPAKPVADILLAYNPTLITLSRSLMKLFYMSAEPLMLNEPIVEL